MSYILHLDANPWDKHSVSRLLAKEQISNWKMADPDGTVTYQDIGHYPIPLVNKVEIAGVFVLPDQRLHKDDTLLTFYEVRY